MTCDLLEELRSIGVEVVPQGDGLAICPASKVPAELKERLRAAKREILAALRERPAHIDPAPVKPCYACHGRLFWRSIYGVVICYRCHAPGSEQLIADILYDGEVKWTQ